MTRWLVPAVCTGLVGGCVLPQDGTLLAELPRQQNRPPRIVETQAQPSQRITTGFGSAGLCELEFSVAVEDPDVNDRLTVRWYFDYDPANPRGPEFELLLPPSGQALRRERASLRVDIRSTTTSLRVPGPHVVEALVADTRLVGRQPEPVYVIEQPDGGSIVNPGYATSYAWFVDTAEVRQCP